MKLLIIYGTTEGQTRKIAEFMHEEAKTMGHEPTTIDSTLTPPPLEDFDAILIGSSIHTGKYHNAVVHFVKDHATLLNEKLTGFFSVSLAAASEMEESWKELEKITTDLLEDTNWQPDEVVQLAGALKYTQYDFFKKFIMRMIAKKEGGETDTSKDYEYTNWEQAKEFLHKVLSLVKA